MNLQQIMTEGIVDEWTPKIPCQITEIKETKNRTQANRQMTKCKVADVSMKDVGCWIYTDETAVQINMSLIINGMLKEYQGKRYLDYCKIERVLPQNAPQTPRNAPKQTSLGSNERNTSIERQCAWKSACHRARGTEMDISDIEDLAMIGIHFIETGNRIRNQPPQEEDDIPF